MPAEIDSFLMPRVHSGKRFGGAGVHRQHLHDCLTFIPTPSLQCVALLAKFQLKCHEMFAHQAMRYGNEKIGTCFAFVSYVRLISRLSLSLEGDLEPIETTCGDARGMGGLYGFILVTRICKKMWCTWWILVVFGCFSGNQGGNGKIIISRGPWGLTYLGYFQL